MRKRSKFRTLKTQKTFGAHLESYSALRMIQYEVQAGFEAIESLHNNAMGSASVQDDTTIKTLV